jgi:hypothetical protein
VNRVLPLRVSAAFRSLDKTQDQSGLEQGNSFLLVVRMSKETPNRALVARPVCPRFAPVLWALTWGLSGKPVTYNRNVRDHDEFTVKLRYLHRNPVKHGLVEN